MYANSKAQEISLSVISEPNAIAAIIIYNFARSFYPSMTIHDWKE